MLGSTTGDDVAAEQELCDELDTTLREAGGTLRRSVSGVRKLLAATTGLRTDLARIEQETSRAATEWLAGLTPQQEARVVAIAGDTGNWELDTIELDGIVGHGGALRILMDVMTWRWGFVKDMPAIASMDQHSPRTQPRASMRSTPCQVDCGTLQRYMAGIADGYIEANPYHTATHAADVAHVVHCFMLSPVLIGILSPAQRLAALLAAAVHDFRHPGLTNKFMEATGHELALVYNDKSILENFHISEALRLMRSDSSVNVLDTLNDPPTARSVRKLMTELVLATDMAQHNSILSKFTAVVLPIARSASEMVATRMEAIGGAGARPPPAGESDVASVVGGAPPSPVSSDDGPGASLNALLQLREQADLILKALVHTADVSNPAKPLHVYEKWVDKVMGEFYNLGDRERALDMEISPYCDRTAPAAADCQVGFITFIVRPLFVAAGELLHDLRPVYTDLLESNLAHFQQIVAAGKADANEKVEEVTSAEEQNDDDQGRQGSRP